MDQSRILAITARNVPVWLEQLRAAKFSNGCSRHRDGNRTECNKFYLDCHDAAGAFCPYCRSTSHEKHTVVQIRKLSYHNAVRVAVMKNLLELSDVRPYVINSAQVVFLNERPTKNKSSLSSSGSVKSRTHSTFFSPSPLKLSSTYLDATCKNSVHPTCFDCLGNLADICRPYSFPVNGVHRVLRPQLSPSFFHLVQQFFSMLPSQHRLLSSH